MSDEPPVVRLVTRAERTAEESAAYGDQVHAECVAMLEGLLAAAKERKLAGVAIAMTYADGCYGTLIPTQLHGADRLIGAAQTLVHALIVKTNTP